MSFYKAHQHPNQGFILRINHSRPINWIFLISIAYYFFQQFDYHCNLSNFLNNLLRIIFSDMCLQKICWICACENFTVYFLFYCYNWNEIIWTWLFHYLCRGFNEVKANARWRESAYFDRSKKRRRGLLKGSRLS